jgi:hypothetical protein
MEKASCDSAEGWLYYFPSSLSGEKGKLLFLVSFLSDSEAELQCRRR